MAKITRIKAQDPAKPKAEKNTPKQAAAAEEAKLSKTKVASKPAKQDGADKKQGKVAQKQDKAATKQAKLARKQTKKAARTSKLQPKRVLLFPLAPFVKLGQYIKNSWSELRQVRWPNRKTTWKMLFAVIIYTAIFITFIMLLDALFTLLFNNLLR